MPLAVCVAAAVGRRCIIADQLDDFSAARPGALGGLPGLDPFVLRLDLPFLGALGLDEAVSFALQNPHFHHSSSSSPFETPY